MNFLGMGRWGGVGEDIKFRVSVLILIKICAMMQLLVDRGQLTQLVECHLDVVKVGGSSPSLPTNAVW